jgi:hypothetical protein
VGQGQNVGEEGDRSGQSLTWLPLLPSFPPQATEERALAFCPVSTLLSQGPPLTCLLPC